MMYNRRMKVEKDCKMIRFIIGLLIVMGAVGGLDNDPDASLLVLCFIAGVGLFVMHSGVHAIGRKYE